MSGFHRSPHLFVNRIALKVADLTASIQFYQEILGFQVLERAANRVLLTADGSTPLVTLEMPPGVKPKQLRTTGLYHFAILLPDRAHLGSLLQHLHQQGYPLQGGTNHLVSEALYLRDPDRNGIEIYADTPPDTWEWQDGLVKADNQMLDTAGLLALAKGKKWERLPKDTLMGHIHLHVSELAQTEDFYRNGLGFDIVIRSHQALFFSTGKYHHHVAANVWNGVGAPAPPENSVGMDYFSLVFPGEGARQETINRLQELGYPIEKKNDAYFTQDPSKNRIQLSL